MLVLNLNNTGTKSDECYTNSSSDFVDSIIEGWLHNDRHSPLGKNDIELNRNSDEPSNLLFSSNTTTDNKSIYSVS